MVRSSRPLGRPFRAVVLALAVHVVFAAFFGVSFQLEPKIVQASQARPIKVAVIDLAVMELEKNRKAEQQRQREEEARRQAENKKAEQLEDKRQADLKKRQEVERERKIEEKKQRQAEAKRKEEEKRQVTVKRETEEKKKKAAEAKHQAEEKKQREAQAKKKREAEAKRQVEEKKKREAQAKKKREAEAKRQAEEKRKKEAEAERQAEEKRKKEAEAERQAKEKKKREAQEARQRDEQAAGTALGALVGEIRDKVRRNWTYAGEATGLEMIISVKVTRDGEVISVDVVRGSGDSIFDRSAENAVLKASPLPFPDNPKFYEFINEFNFKLSRDG